MTNSPTVTPPWIETTAEVTACRYQFARMNTLTLGVGSDGKQFVITFTYRAHGKTYTDEFTAPAYIEQGTVFTLSYNPAAPQQNTKSASSPATGTPLFAIAVAGSIVLSVIYLTFLRGCS